MGNFFSNIRKLKNVAIAIWISVAVLGVVLFLLDFKNLTGYQLGSLILMCFFLGVTIAVGIIDLKKGVEQRIEISIGFLLISLILLVISFVVEDLTKADSLEITRTLAVILAGAIAIFGLCIAYLNYKRKSGLYVECGIYLRMDKLNPSVIGIYFTNLKDRATMFLKLKMWSLSDIWRSL